VVRNSKTKNLYVLDRSPEVPTQEEFTSKEFEAKEKAKALGKEAYIAAKNRGTPEKQAVAIAKATEEEAFAKLS
jgi:hypothetical protein